MRLPSIKTLSAITDKPKVLRAILEGEINIDTPNLREQFPHTAAWINQCYHRPGKNHVAMTLADELLGTYGVEGFAMTRGEQCEYCNTGDSYENTLIAIGKPAWFGGRTWTYRVCSWWDIAERRAAE